VQNLIGRDTNNAKEQPRWATLTNSRNITVIGAGKMGEAIIAGLLKSEAFSPQNIRIFEIAKNRREYITKTYDVQAVDREEEAVAFGDIILIAVKPGVVGKVLDQIKNAVSSEKVIVSIAAGVTIEYLKEHVPSSVPVIRVMPNLACSVREAMMVICPSENTTDEQLNTVTNVLNSIGKVMKLEEKYLNLATGLVGSGPAYIFLVIEALADAGVRLGLPKEISITLAAQTTLGAAKMVVETGEHPAKLKDMVATPAGTTVEGLFALEQGKLRATLISAVTEAAKKAGGLLPA
jgi:pyrroline-5-carboxylate reductase